MEVKPSYDGDVTVRLIEALESERFVVDELRSIGENAPKDRKHTLLLAALDVENGLELGDALLRRQALPRAYIEAVLTTSIPAAVAITEAIRRHRAFRVQLGSSVLACTGLLLLICLALMVGVHSSVPQLHAAKEELGSSMPILWTLSALAARLFFGPVGLIALAALAWYSWKKPERLAVLIGPGYDRLGAQAAAARALHSLIVAGAALPRALRAVAEIAEEKSVETGFNVAAVRIAGGDSVDRVFRSLIGPTELGNLWATAARNGTVAQTVGHMASLLEATFQTHLVTLSYRVRARYAMVAGALVLWGGAIVYWGFAELWA